MRRNVRTLIFVVALLFTGTSSAAYKVVWQTIYSSTVSDLSCSTVRSTMNAQPEVIGWGVTITSCATNPITPGSTFTWSNGTTGTFNTITFVCGAGTHLDTSTNTCVDDVTIAVASCMPSIRTISPCPSGYAPTNAIPAGSGAPSPFTSAYDGLPIQDMIYAVGIAVCALLGVSVGVKLI